mmetsp:Transcript_23582/g.56913  ORF Transcript_23582/g.56913 Transcript_23582/m.56913 type:complete len:319 (-) Transcript_23582:52-1008(-)
MNIAIRIAAAILSVPPDVLAPMVPMMAPPPQNSLEFDLRNEVDSVLSGSCCRSSADGAPLFAISREESNYVNCNSGLPSINEGLFESENSDDESSSSDPSTYGEITSLGARQLFHHMGLTNNAQKNQNYQFFDLGSGGGRLVIQSHLELPSLSKSVGIELSPSRHKIALQTWQSLMQNGDAVRIRNLAEKSGGMDIDDVKSTVELYEGDLFKLDISQSTHLYVSSLCFSEDMLERLVDKIESEGKSLKIVASLRMLPKEGKLRHDETKIKYFTLGSNPWMEFVEMSWTKARGDGCPVYFYSVKRLNDDLLDESKSHLI